MLLFDPMGDFSATPRSWHLDTRLTDPCWSFDPSTAALLETLVHPNDPMTQNPPDSPIRKILRGSFGRLDPTTRQRFT